MSEPKLPVTGDWPAAQAASNSNDLKSAAIPTTIGRYRLGRFLGQGGFGIVYLAHDDQLSRPVAVKMLHPDPAIPAALLLRERNLAAMLVALSSSRP